ncbi:hypothetical protein P2A09_20965, partial [Xanthomonas perforans]
PSRSSSTGVSARRRKARHRTAWAVAGSAPATPRRAARAPLHSRGGSIPPPLARRDRRYYRHPPKGPPLLHELLLWNAGSMALTFVISYLWIRRTLRAPEPDGLDR